MKLDSTLIIPDLTYENAKVRGYVWIEDNKKLETLQEFERDAKIRQIVDYEYVVGAPAQDDQTDKYIGLYIKQLPNLPIDETLTPESAEGRGYTWEADVTYDRENSKKAMGYIIDLVQKDKYVLGEPAGSSGEHGLYSPLEK
ncbi:MAG: hypothetical protein ABI758_00305 [Candidatus Woesebacteria bacterium]